MTEQKIAFDHRIGMSVSVPRDTLEELKKLDPPASRYEIAKYGAYNDPVGLVVKSRLEVIPEDEGVKKPTYSELNNMANCVYFIQEEDDGPIKIGYAAHVGRRYFTLQTGNPRKLHVLAAVQAGKDLEKELHRQFAHNRVVREWYEPSKELLETINKLTAGSLFAPLNI